MSNLPKPYISTKHKKEPKETVQLFNTIVEKYIEKLDTDEFNLHFKSKFIGNDARSFKAKNYYNKN